MKFHEENLGYDNAVKKFWKTMCDMITGEHQQEVLLHGLIERFKTAIKRIEAAKQKKN
jgi:hypothetical protein